MARKASNFTHNNEGLLVLLFAFAILVRSVSSTSPQTLLLSSPWLPRMIDLTSSTLSRQALFTRSSNPVGCGTTNDEPQWSALLSLPDAASLTAFVASSSLTPPSQPLAAVIPSGMLSNYTITTLLPLGVDSFVVLDEGAPPDNGQSWTPSTAPASIWGWGDGAEYMQLRGVQVVLVGDSRDKDFIKSLAAENVPRDDYHVEVRFVEVF